MPISHELLNVLNDAQRRKFIGPGSLRLHIDNAARFVHIIRDLDNGQWTEPAIVDLGSGGGVPALVVGELFPAAQLRLIERGSNRARFLSHSVLQLGMQDRIEVVTANAEEAAHQPDLNGWADVVTARGFAPPMVTAECACRFLKPGGTLIVSEPPFDSAGSERWPRDALYPTGLVPAHVIRYEMSSFQTLTLTGTTQAGLPRRASATRKRPLA